MNREDLGVAKRLAENWELDQAYAISGSFLMENPNDLQALVVTSFILRRARKLPEAYYLAKRVTEIDPDEAAGWINFGQIAGELFRVDEAERAYKRGLSVAKDPNSRSMILTNMAALYIDLGRFDEAHKAATKSLEEKPDSRPARANLGFCQLAKHEWAEGWKNYKFSLGGETRKKAHYRPVEEMEPEWDGAEGKRVILYGEQGIGDEICFASMVPDAIERASHIILDIDPRLEKLFKRSFPKASVYGTRICNDKEGRKWDVKDRVFDCSLAIAQIGAFFRLKDEDFPAKPYLVPDYDRVLMWRALWEKKGKPVIGLAWTGGQWQTGAKFRKLSLEQYLPIMQAVDAHFVVLQYKDASNELKRFKAKHPGIDIEQYSYATLTKDYDDTASLVASLDCVVSVPTAVVHLAAALGTPCIAMNSPHRCWKFYGDLVMHPKVELVPNTGWDSTIMEASRRLSKRINKQEAA